MRNSKHILIIFLALVIWSCGTRKTQKTVVDLHTELSDNSVKAENSGTTLTAETTIYKTENTQVSVAAEAEIMVPIDPEKPMIKTGPDGKTTIYRNASVTTGKKSSTEVSTIQNKAQVKEVQHDTTSTIENKDVKLKQTSKASAKTTAREGIGTKIEFWIAGGIALGIVLFFIWFVYRKYKKGNDEIA